MSTRARRIGSSSTLRPQWSTATYCRSGRARPPPLTERADKANGTSPAPRRRGARGEERPSHFGSRARRRGAPGARRRIIGGRASRWALRADLSPSDAARDRAGLFDGLRDGDQRRSPGNRRRPRDRPRWSAVDRALVLIALASLYLVAGALGDRLEPAEDVHSRHRWLRRSVCPWAESPRMRPSSSWPASSRGPRARPADREPVAASHRSFGEASGRAIGIWTAGTGASEPRWPTARGSAR